MAEVIILPLANSILKSIASFTGDRVRDNVAEEIKGFKSVKEDLKAIAKDLESITCVLKDAEAKQYNNEAMKMWLRDLKSVVYDIDDLLDDVATDALQRSVNEGHFFPKLRSSQMKKLPSSIRNLKHLRFLDLSMNPHIKYLPDTICDLLNLQCLLLDGCEQLEEIPLNIYKLTNLRLFTITTCQRSLVDNKYSRLRSLLHLCFFSCKGLISLWDSNAIGCLTSLRSLHITDCPKLQSLPNSMKLLVGLGELRISNCEELDLETGDGLSGLHGLQTLLIQDVPRLSCFPESMCSAAISLKHLAIGNCQGLVDLPNWLHSCASLERLIIQNCRSLFSLTKGIRHLNALQYLAISKCPHLSWRCAVPDGQDLSLIRHVPEIWLDGSRLTPNQQ